MKLSSRKKLLAEADAELKRMSTPPTSLKEADGIKMDLKIDELKRKLSNAENAYRAPIPQDYYLTEFLESIVSALEEIQKKYNDM